MLSNNSSGEKMDIDSSVQPSQRVTFPGTAEELPGKLEVPDRPVVAARNAHIYYGVWTSPEGRQLEVAIKEFPVPIPRDRRSDPEALRRRTDKRLRREVFVWSRTTHPNLHPLLGYRSQPQPRLISPWCRHGNLTDYLRENPGFSRRIKLCLIHEAALGLGHLHSCVPPICHGDIKPENVLINDFYVATLSDFGLGRVLEDLGESSGITSSEGPKGTLNYMAGELFLDEKRRPSLQSDVFAFGGLVLTVMSGKPPFHGLQEHIVLRRLMFDQPPKPEDHPDLPRYDPLWSLIQRCWNKSPSARPAMREVLWELWRDISDEQPDPALRPGVLSIINTSAMPMTRW